MKRLILVFFAGIAFSCNNEVTTASTKDSTVTTAAPATDYPYTIKHPDNWEVGSTANTMIALKCLKTWEERKIDESLKYFADSIHLEFDALDKKVPKDSLKAMFVSDWNNNKSVSIKMSDWESVISKDKKEEWVTLWYRQYWETQKGLKDSIDVTNDLLIKDGKIIALEEYTRKLH